jgi:hypothetical protein
MSGLFFDYRPGRIDARLSHGSEFDTIVLRIRMWGAVVTTTSCDDEFRLGRSVDRVAQRIDCSVHMTSVFCPFADFVRFLEAIAVQVQECAFDWDAEGPDGRMLWRRRFPDQDGFLTVSWKGSYAGHKQTFSYRMMLGTRQTVQMLYTAFRRFVESPEYDPIRYERLEIGDAIDLVLADATREDFARVIATLDREAAERMLAGALNAVDLRTRHQAAPDERPTLAALRGGMGANAGFDEQTRWIAREWDGWTNDRRRVEVHERIFGSEVNGWYGGNLRQLRSSIIERWLASVTPVKRALGMVDHGEPSWETT